jgi:dolichyl-phosphate-mannose--protein O-mannosyl transferase
MIKVLIFNYFFFFGFFGMIKKKLSFPINKIYIIFESQIGSLWLVKEGSKAKEVCELGTPIKCNEIVRLEHVDTGKNLHSHLFKSPLSGNQEVSAFGEHGTGDTGDNWTVQCETNDVLWQRYKQVIFVHVDTGKFLSTSDSFKFNQQNCGGSDFIIILILLYIY